MSNREELKTYLNDHVNPIIKVLIRDILESKTTDVVDFIKDWCDKKGKDVESDLKEKKNYNADHLPVSVESQEELEDDIISLTEIQKKQRKTKKKLGISAEAYGEYNKLGDFKPRVIPKTDQQKELIKKILAKNFMFNSLEGADQEIVISAMEIKTYKDKDVVIKQGDDGEELFIVQEGNLTCSKLFEGKTEETFLKEYQPGEVFGELALMYNAPRAASIYSKGDSTLLSVDRDTFNHIVKNATIEKRKQYDGFLNKIEILSTLDNYEREKICDCLQSQVYKKDEKIIVQGQTGDRFYLVQSGTAQAQKDGEPVYDYKENDYFGELALLGNGDVRQASIVVTSEEMKVAWLSKDSFKRLLGSLEEILQRNKEKYSKYVKDAKSE